MNAAAVEDAIRRIAGVTFENDGAPIDAAMRCVWYAERLIRVREIAFNALADLRAAEIVARRAERRAAGEVTP